MGVPDFLTPAPPIGYFVCLNTKYRIPLFQLITIKCITVFLSQLKYHFTIFMDI